MLKRSFIKLIFLNQICVFSLHKLFNSFFLFSKGVASIISKTRLFRCISGINVSPATKNVFLISFIFIYSIELHLKQNIQQLKFTEECLNS